MNLKRITFTAVKISIKAELEVTLNSLDNLVARRDDNKINFGLKIALLPIPGDKNYKKEFKTKIYNDHDSNEPHLFDLALDGVTQDTFKFTFPLEDNGKDEFGNYKIGENQFLQFSLYEHSRTKTNKWMLGKDIYTHLSLINVDPCLFFLKNLSSPHI